MPSGNFQPSAAPLTPENVFIHSSRIGFKGALLEWANVIRTVKPNTVKASRQFIAKNIEPYTQNKSKVESNRNSFSFCNKSFEILTQQIRIVALPESSLFYYMARKANSFGRLRMESI